VSDKNWRLLCQVLERADLLDDPTLATNDLTPISVKATMARQDNQICPAGEEGRHPAGLSTRGHTVGAGAIVTEGQHDRTGLSDPQELVHV